MYTTFTMTSEVVSFRFPKEHLEKLRERGLNPNTVAKEALEIRLREIQAGEDLDWIAASGITLDEDPVDLIRRDRESH